MAYWNITSQRNLQLDPKAAEAIFGAYAAVRSLVYKLDQIDDQDSPIKTRFVLANFRGALLGHAVRTAVMCALIAQKLNVDPVQSALDGFFHDLGKFEEEVMRYVRKSGKLELNEYKKVKEHPQLGFKYLALIKPFLAEKHGETEGPMLAITKPPMEPDTHTESKTRIYAAKSWLLPMPLMP
ncbi:hypothetical protein IPJ72_01545 [Candidatus Peregrinibacteria bacterium]|nr:MAG: hypothetical protein IPJ72_01545 [Candidatus Peregrinibacteria bacterium]